MKSCLIEKEWTFSKTGGYKADFLVTGWNRMEMML